MQRSIPKNRHILDQDYAGDLPKKTKLSRGQEGWPLRHTRSPEGLQTGVVRQNTAGCDSQGWQNASRRTGVTSVEGCLRATRHFLCKHRFFLTVSMMWKF